MNQPSVHIVAKWLGYPVVELPPVVKSRFYNAMPEPSNYPQGRSSKYVTEEYLEKTLDTLKGIGTSFTFTDMVKQIAYVIGDEKRAFNRARHARSRLVSVNVIRPVGNEGQKTIYAWSERYESYASKWH